MYGTGYCIETDKSKESTSDKLGSGYAEWKFLLVVKNRRHHIHSCYAQFYPTNQRLTLELHLHSSYTLFEFFGRKVFAHAINFDWETKWRQLLRKSNNDS